MNATNSEIETIMSSVPQSKQDPRATPELTRSHSDVAAMFSRRGRELKDKIGRSRSIDPTKIQVNSARAFLLITFKVLHNQASTYLTKLLIIIIIIIPRDYFVHLLKTCFGVQPIILKL